MPIATIAYNSELVPIQIEQAKKPKLYRNLRKWGAISSLHWFLATQEVLQLILNSRKTADSTKQTVWHFWKRYGQETYPRYFHEKIGTGFLDISFANECFTLSEKRAQELIYSQSIYSHQSPNFGNEQFGVSMRLVFELISLTGKTRTINCVSGIAGLNEWENLALILGLNYRLGLIKTCNEQFQNILEIADKLAYFRPKDISVSQYVKNLFYIINRELPLKAI